MKDLNVQGMMKIRHLSRAVQEQCFYEFYRQIEYKSLWHNIELVTADIYYSSSKMCSCCGNIRKDLKLSDRIYHCSVVTTFYKFSVTKKMANTINQHLICRICDNPHCICNHCMIDKACCEENRQQCTVHCRFIKIFCPKKVDPGKKR